MLYLIIIFVLLFLIIKQRKTNKFCNSSIRLDGKTIIVTGGTSGIGLEIAKDFARRGAKIIVACPFEEEGKNAEKTIVEDTENNQVYFKLLDFGSFKSVRKFAADIIQTEKRLDILVNNAGAGVPDLVTQDGLNSLMQINYYGHFLLTLLLLPLLKKTGTPLAPARILNNSSLTHYGARMKYINLRDSGYFYCNLFLIYATSKLCLASFTRELDKKLDANVIVNTVDPGAVGTNLITTSGVVIGSVTKMIFNTFFNTPREGAQTAIHVAIHTKGNEVRGKYFRACKPVQPSSTVTDDRICTSIWEDSVINVKLTEEELQECRRSK